MSLVVFIVVRRYVKVARKGNTARTETIHLVLLFIEDVDVKSCYSVFINNDFS